MSSDAPNMERTQPSWEADLTETPGLYDHTAEIPTTDHIGDHKYRQNIPDADV